MIFKAVSSRPFVCLSPAALHRVHSAAVQGQGELASTCTCACMFDLLCAVAQEMQTLQSQLEQQKEQLAQSEATKLEIEAVRDYRHLRKQQQQLEGQVAQLTQQLDQVGGTCARQQLSALQLQRGCQRPLEHLGGSGLAGTVTGGACVPVLRTQASPVLLFSVCLHNQPPPDRVEGGP